MSHHHAASTSAPQISDHRLSDLAAELSGPDERPVAVLCESLACRWYLRQREVSLPSLGHGVFVAPALVCECGRALGLVPR